VLQHFEALQSSKQPNNQTTNQPDPQHTTETDFRFVEPYAVTYWAQTARAWITHGSLTAPMGLTATLMYGFSSPDGSAWIIAGSVPGTVSDVAASGAWTGYLFGLVQVGSCLTGSSAICR